MSIRRKKLKWWKWVRRHRKIIPVEWFYKSGMVYQKYGIGPAKGWARIENQAAFRFVGYKGWSPKLIWWEWRDLCGGRGL